MNNKIETNKRELITFLLVAFGVPYLMGIPLGICQAAGKDTSLFANAQMFYPAAGVMLAYLLARRPGLPVRFYLLHIVSAKKAHPSATIHQPFHQEAQAFVIFR